MKKMFIILIGTLIVIAGCGSKYDEISMDAFANCLADKGIKEYGAFWCPNCAKQEKMFEDSYDIIMERGVYIECDARGDNEQSALCIEKGIQGYPTWEFQDGMMLQGVMELHTIAEKAGCEAPRPE